MKYAVGALVALVIGGLAVSGQAADLIVDEPAAMAQPTSGDWDGAYLGVFGGYASSDFNYVYNETSFALDPSGLIGGVTAGYNLSSGSMVFGLEGDLGIGSLSAEETADLGIAPCYEDGCTAELNWLGTLRGRLGFDGGGFMPYLTAGLAAGGISGSVDTGACGYVNCGFDRVAMGYALGAGVEAMVSDSMSLKAEYLYVNLGDPKIEPDNDGAMGESSVSAHVARVGLNFHF